MHFHTLFSKERVEHQNYSRANFSIRFFTKENKWIESPENIFSHFIWIEFQVLGEKKCMEIMGKTSIQTYTEKSRIAYFPHIIILKVILFCCCSSRSVVSDSANPWMAAHHASLSFTIFLSFFKIHVHWVDDIIQPPHPLLPSSLLALSFYQHRDLFQ